MIENRSIICFAHDWGGDPTSKTHIMRILSRRNRVLWVNSIGMRRPTPSSRDLKRVFAKLRRTLLGCIEVEPNIFVTNPLVLPLPGIRLVDRLNAEILAASLRRLCQNHSMDHPILWTFLPNVNRLVGRLREQLVVYHCVDEYSAFSGVRRSLLIQMEQDLIRHAHLVFTSSEQLCHERQPINPNTHYISHGVDVSHFSRALAHDTEIPEDLRILPSPVVGFFGLLADWVDLELVKQLAIARPNWSIALVGKATTDLGLFEGVSNIHLLGQKPYSSLPGYCRGFDVGIIPFRMNALTVRANPLKLREYLAAGLPVVSTDLPEVARYNTLVHLAESPDAFIAGVEMALGERCDAMVKRRIEQMQLESWEMRVADMEALICSQLGFPTE